jgi:hypothetical protein
MDLNKLNTKDLSSFSTDTLKVTRIKLYSFKRQLMIKKKDIDKNLSKLIDMHSILNEADNKNEELKQQIETNVKERNELVSKILKIDEKNIKIITVMNNIDNELCRREYK